MKNEAQAHWTNANHAFLVAALREIRDLLSARCEQLGLELPRLAGDETEAVASSLSDDPAALSTLSSTFDLSAFEQKILLLCAGVELDSCIASLCAHLQGGGRAQPPTFSLALSLFPDAHWSALSPAAPLRYWHLIELARESSLTASPLRIDERILHYLTGVDFLEERLWGILTPWTAPKRLTRSQESVAEELTKACSIPSERYASPVLLLTGNEKWAKRDLAARACEKMSLRLFVLSFTSAAANPTEQDAILRLCCREAALAGAALLLEFDDGMETGADRTAVVSRLAEQIGILLISAPSAKDYGVPVTLSLEARRPTQSEQREMWSDAVADVDVQRSSLDALAGQFSLDADGIAAAAAEALCNVNGGERSDSSMHAALWDACRNRARFQLDELAMRIEPAAEWADLVLPPTQIAILESIAVHLKHRIRVYHDWGFASKSGRGLGISALFVGESGTGKTLAAEVLARDLRLDLYRIDLSQTVSKYIGETEKNLRRIFGAAERGGAILLFDEADALFGKRSEVKDSHDRYANIEISYLLQLMEAYRGLAILTTNMKNAVDAAFLRRLRFMVQFPFPDAAYRARIWRRVFPAAAPTRNLHFEKLARLNITGGSIRNIALNAAFLAAESRSAVTMSHLAEAAQIEYAKLEKPLMEAEIRGWS